MIPANLIAKKRDGKNLSKDEISWFITNYVSGEISEEQMASLLMAILFQGMNEIETFTLVEVMIDSGSKLDFSDSNYYVADKHSTGGIGDKVSLILAPLMAAAGLQIPMIAGRGLSFTGGTIDKLESIPGFNTSPSLETFNSWVDLNNCAIISQSDQICPADKKLYALRDQTGTVPSNPLICGSIMSKKIASGISGLVLDLKVGNGAFLKNYESAKKLGVWMKKIGEAFGLTTDILFTSMDQPLGRSAGLSCEVLESMDALRGDGSEDLMDITYQLGSKLLIQSNITTDIKESENLQRSLINDGKAFEKFEAMVKVQGGTLEKLETTSHPSNEVSILSNADGVITRMDTEKIGWALVELGCGRKSPKSSLDNTAGIQFLKKIGDEVHENEPIYHLFNSNPKLLNSAKRMLKKTFEIKDSLKKDFRLVLGEF